MKVYVAQREYDYEGFVIIGIFKTRKEAKECCKNDKFKDGEKRGDSHKVEEYEIGELYY